MTLFRDLPIHLCAYVESMKKSEQQQNRLTEQSNHKGQRI